MKYQCICILLLVMNSVVFAEEDPTQATAVARVNNEAVTLHALETELMSQEGADQIERMIREHLKTIDWSKLKDDDIVANIYGLEIPRVWLASKLLDQYGADVREEMIQALLVKQELIKENIVIDQEMKGAMLKRMERRHYAKLEAKGGGTTVSFESAIQQQYGLTPEEWQDDPGFTTLAGMYALIYQSVTVVEDELKQYFEDNIQRYGISEAYELDIIPMHFKIDPQFVVTEKSKQRRRILAKQSFLNIKNGRRSFAQTVKFLDADFKGHRGFVERNGVAGVKGVARVPMPVMEAVFRHQYTEFPTLLGPIESSGGLTIVNVMSYRKGTRVTLEQCRQEVRMDLIDSDAERWVGSYMRALRQDADIDYNSLMDVMVRRREDVQKYVQRKQVDQDEAHK